MIKLLIVDNDHNIAMPLEKFFTSRGYSVFTASSGEEALVIFEKEQPKIVFMDIIMEGNNGIKTLEKIKNINSNTKIIMISTADDKETIEKAKLTGCDAYIIKPFSMNYLETVVAEKIQEILSKPTIMIVDDEADTRTIIEEYLRKRIDAVYLQAADGEEAIRMFKKTPCNLMILDIKMPKKGGLQVIDEVRQIDPHVNILVETAYTGDDVASQSIAKGAVDYLPKPLELKALGAKVRTILKRKGF